MAAPLDYAYILRQRAFSEKTFGPGPRTQGVVDHIRKELKEIEDSGGHDLEEWGDVIILALDGAWREAVEQGLHEDAIFKVVHDKLAKNMTREWPDWRTAEPGKAIEHIR